MRNRGFWDGMALGAGVGVAFGLVTMLLRRRRTPMERTRMIMGKGAKRILRSAQGTLGRVANRFSD
ncbi:MAG: hypothetical protein ACOX3V_00570 [Bacillota bacterium]|jgi:hypothetical protein